MILDQHLFKDRLTITNKATYTKPDLYSVELVLFVSFYFLRWPVATWLYTKASFRMILFSPPHKHNKSTHRIPFRSSSWPGHCHALTIIIKRSRAGYSHFVHRTLCPSHSQQAPTGFYFFYCHHGRSSHPRKKEAKCRTQNQSLVALTSVLQSIWFLCRICVCVCICFCTGNATTWVWFLYIYIYYDDDNIDAFNV